MSVKIEIFQGLVSSWLPAWSTVLVCLNVHPEDYLPLHGHLWFYHIKTCSHTSQPCILIASTVLVSVHQQKRVGGNRITFPFSGRFGSHILVTGGVIFITCFAHSSWIKILFVLSLTWEHLQSNGGKNNWQWFSDSIRLQSAYFTSKLIFYSEYCWTVNTGVNVINSS